MINYDMLKKIADEIGPSPDECKRRFLSKLCSEFEIDTEHIKDYVLIVPKQFLEHIEHLPDWVVLTEYTDEIILYNQNNTIDRKNLRKN